MICEPPVWLATSLGFVCLVRSCRFVPRVRSVRLSLHSFCLVTRSFASCVLSFRLCRPFCYFWSGHDHFVRVACASRLGRPGLSSIEVKMYVRMVKGTVDVMILHAFSCRDVPLRCVLLAFHVSHARQHRSEKIAPGGSRDTFEQAKRGPKS